MRDLLDGYIVKDGMEIAAQQGEFNVAIDDALIESNPVRRVKLLKENNARVRYLTDDEEARLRREIGEEHWPLAALALNSGLRRTELFSLGWEHVDFNTNVLTIPRTKAGRTRRVPMNSLVGASPFAPKPPEKRLRGPECDGGDVARLAELHESRVHARREACRHPCLPLA